MSVWQINTFFLTVFPLRLLPRGNRTKVGNSIINTLLGECHEVEPREHVLFSLGQHLFQEALLEKTEAERPSLQVDAEAAKVRQKLGHGDEWNEALWGENRNKKANLVIN